MQLLPFAHFLLRLLDFIEHYLVWRENEVLFDHWAKLNFNKCGFKTSSNKQTKLTILEDYNLKVNTKRESMFFLQEDRL